MLLKHGADVGKENRSGWTGERVAASLHPPASCPDTDRGMEMGMEMGVGINMDVDTDTGAGMVVLTLVLQLPKALLTWCCVPVAPVQCPALQYQVCHAVPRRAMAPGTAPLPHSPAGGCEHP